MALLIGSIVVVDLKLLGAGPGLDQEAVLHLALPVSAAGFILAAIAGLLLFATDAPDYAGNPVFLIKLIVIAAALINALLLRVWASHAGPAAAVLSLGLWTAALILGRWIAYW